MPINLARNFLQSYKTNKWLLERIKGQINAKRCLLDLKGVSYDGVKVKSSGGSDHGDVVADIADLSSEYKEVWNKAYKDMEEIKKTIERVDNERLKLLLSKYYIEDKPWSKVADEMGLSPRQIFRLRDDALKEIEKIITDDIECHR